MTTTMHLEAHGNGGATVTFDGQTITISRKGMAAALTAGRGDKRIDARHVTAIQFKTASLMMAGYIQFSFSGESGARTRQSIQQKARDENLIQFPKSAQPAFEALRDAIEAVRIAPTSPVVVQTAPTAADRLRQLAELQAAGIITSAEYEAKRAELVAQL